MQTIPSIDLYRELEVDPAATAETIDAAWKSLLKRHHPDVASDRTAAVERVKRLNLAHEWLADPGRRAMYDASRRRPGVIVLPRPERPADHRRTQRTARTVSPEQPERGQRATDAGAGTAEPAEPEDPRSGRDPSDHNPYAEYDAPRRRAAGMPLTDRPSAAVVKSGRVIPLLAPLALALVLIMVALSSIVSPRATSPVAAESTSTPAPSQGVQAATAPAGIATISTEIGALASGAANPRGLPAPDVDAAVPPECRSQQPTGPLSFETTVASAPALVYVVFCTATESYGPLVFVAGDHGWDLRVSGGRLPAGAQTGISGSITAPDAEEFGIAWGHNQGIDSTLSLYRIDGNTVTRFWDSGDIGLAWSLASFHWHDSTDPSVPGQLEVIAADMTTGTPGCGACRDHHLYRAIYDWQSVLGRGQLHQISSEPYVAGQP